jgi:hypothetical protein
MKIPLDMREFHGESGHDNPRAVAGADFPWVGAAGGFSVGGAVGAVAEGMGGKS